VCWCIGDGLFFDSRISRRTRTPLFHYIRPYYGLCRPPPPEGLIKYCTRLYVFLTIRLSCGNPKMTEMLHVTCVYYTVTLHPSENERQRPQDDVDCANQFTAQRHQVLMTNEPRLGTYCQAFGDIVTWRTVRVRGRKVRELWVCRVIAVSDFRTRQYVTAQGRIRNDVYTACSTWVFYTILYIDSMSEHWAWWSWNVKNTNLLVCRVMHLSVIVTGYHAICASCFLIEKPEMNFKWLFLTIIWKKKQITATAAYEFSDVFAMHAFSRI